MKRIWAWVAEMVVLAGMAVIVYAGFLISEILGYALGGAALIIVGRAYAPPTPDRSEGE